MQMYISFLRGINVGGHKKVNMAELKALYQNLGFDAVSTYIQSGNVVFRSSKKWLDLELADQIEKAIAEKFLFPVPVVIRSAAEIEQVITENPFLTATNVDPEKLHVTFLSETPAIEKVEHLKIPAGVPDRFIIFGKNVYLHCGGSYSDTKLSNQFFETQLKVKATTRNWKTVNKMLILASS